MASETDEGGWSHNCDNPKTAASLLVHFLGNYYTLMRRIAVKKSDGWEETMRTSRVALAGNLYLMMMQMRRHNHTAVAKYLEEVLELVTGPEALSQKTNERVFLLAKEIGKHADHWRSKLPSYKVIRAGTRYDPVIVVTPPDAGPDTKGAKCYELSTFKDGNGISGWKVGEFNEISQREALVAFSGMADGWGFADDIPTEPFLSLEDALTFVRTKRAA